MAAQPDDGSLLGEFCGPPNNDSVIWPNSKYGYCKELLVFDLTSHVMLAVSSGLYIGYIQNTEHQNLKKSRALKSRQIVSFLTSLIPLIHIIWSLLNTHVKLSPVEYLTYSCTFLAWIVHTVYLVKLRRAGIKHIRGHVPVLLMWPLTLLSTVVKVVGVVKTLKHEATSNLEEIERILTFVGIALQLLYLLTVLPSPKHARANYERSQGRRIFPSINDDAADEESPLVRGRRRLYSRDEYGALVELGVAEEHANFFSKMVLSWVQPLMKRGARGDLRTADDVFRLPWELQTRNVEESFSEVFFKGSMAYSVTNYNTSYSSTPQGNVNMPADSLFSDELLHGLPVNSYSSDFEDSITHEIRSPQSSTCRPKSQAKCTLLGALLGVFGLRYFALGVVKFVCDLLSFSGPLLLNALVSFMENKHKEPVLNGWLYAGGLCLSSFSVAFISIHYNYQIFKILIRMRAAIVTMTYRKALVVSTTTLSKFTTGEIVNFMSVDAERIINICQSFHELWSLPVKIGVALFLLHQQLGLAFLTGVGFTLLLVLMTKWLTIKIQKYFEDLMKHKDSRIKAMNEVLYGIRVIKFYAWEKHFARKIKRLRDLELSSLKGIKYLDALCVYFWATTPVLISILSFTTYSLLGNQLTAAKIFTSLALFNMLIGPLNSFPWVLNGVIQAWVSLKRVQRFLELQELNPSMYYTPDDAMDPNCYLEIKHGSFQWERPLKKDTSKDGGSSKDDEEGEVDDEEFGTLRLSNLNLRVGRGQLVGVIGSVGSGKSSLLSAITAEMTKSGGAISVSNLGDGFGLAPQEAWIQHATLRENIMFGVEYIPRRYRAVMQACALLEDIKMLPAGDQTEIGENGVTLSGGQKARVALARAVYQDKDVYLMDDPLAAVDAHVGAHIFSKCIMGLLQNKTRILCTHHTKYLQEADLVVVMEHGEITNAGHPSVILKNKELITTLQYDDSEKEESVEDQPMRDKKEAEALAGDEGADGKLVQEEEKDVGVVKLHVYKAYWNAIGCILASSVLIALFLMQASRNMTDWWLSYWVSYTHSQVHINSIMTNNFPIETLHNRSNSAMLDPSVPSTRINLTSGDNLRFYLGIYGGLVGANSIFTLFRAFLFAYGGLCAARTVHKRLLSSVMKAPVSFFDVTPIGRIINRFSSDVYTIDDGLPFVLNIFLASLFSTVGALVVTCYGLPWFALVLLPMVLIYMYIQNYYRKTSRELRRIESVTMSPIYAHFSETLTGLSTIRALRTSNRFRLENASKLETNQRARFCSFAVTCWLSFCLQMLGVAIITMVAIIAVLEHRFESVNPGLVGLAISYTLSISALLQSLVTTFTDTEKNMVSMERAQQYTVDVPWEQQEGIRKAPSSWPQNGQVSFHNVSFAYRANLPNALNGVTLELRPAEKLGIVGRTGSGKSSLLLVLFRMVEIQTGRVTIDGVDTAHLSLEELRSKLAIIPQDPFLFYGSVRENLDPTGQFREFELWSVLNKCHLKSAVEALGGLEAEAGEKGRRFSAGQRQLMCLARAMLSGAKVLCIDEATASVDMETDQLLQQTIRQEFVNSTVLTIAHRINTILDSDRVLVMNGGQVAELASPQLLLEDPSSMFYGLVNSGATSADVNE